jgi:steroid delta-isomerase-like uncharacterized protein
MGPNEATLRRWFAELWEQGRIERFHELAHPDMTFHTVGMTGETLAGVAGFRTLYDPIRAAFSNIKFAFHDAVEADNTAAIRWTMTMNHTGSELGVAPSGKPVTVTGISFVRFRDGKVAESWDEWDRLGFMKQAGIPLI